MSGNEQTDSRGLPIAPSLPAAASAVSGDRPDAMQGGGRAANPGSLLVDPEFSHPDASSPLTIVASRRQRGNPLLAHLLEVKVTFANIVPDYLISPSHAAVFISLKYHRMHSDYLPKRIVALGRYYRVRLVLCLVDLPDFEQPLEQVTLLAFQTSMSLFLAWSPTEAARVLQTLKHVEETPPDSIQGRPDEDPQQRAAAVLTAIPAINMVDSVTLLREFGSIRQLMDAQKADVLKCPGIGDKKLRNIWRALHGPLGRGRARDAAGGSHGAKTSLEPGGPGT